LSEIEESKDKKKSFREQLPSAKKIIFSLEALSIFFAVIEYLIYPPIAKFLLIELSPIELLSLWFIQYLVLKVGFTFSKDISKIKNKGAKQEELKSLKELVEKQRQVFFTRDSFILHNEVSQAQKKVFCSGTTLHALTVGIRDTLDEKYKEGCEFYFLLVHPKEVADFAGMVNLRKDSILNDLTSSLSALKPYLGKISDKGGRIEVKLQPAFPGFTIFAMDPDCVHSKVKVELQINNKDPHSWINFSVEKDLDKKWFDIVLAHFMNTWNSLNTLTPEETELLLKQYGLNNQRHAS
jgi:hypothetical protein